MATKIAMQTFLKHKLATDAQWAQKALLAVYANQTASEQATKATREDNGIGFGGRDAEFLSSLAEKLAQWGKLTGDANGGQMKWVFKLIPKYWGQVLPLIQGDKRNKFEAAAQAFYDARKAEAAKAAPAQGALPHAEDSRELEIERHLAALAR